LQINVRKFLVLYYTKKKRCEICNTSLYKQVVYSNRQKRYCVYCAIIKNFLDIQDMNSYGYFPDGVIFQKTLEKKKQKIIQMIENNIIKQRDNKIKLMRKKQLCFS